MRIWMILCLALACAAQLCRAQAWPAANVTWENRIAREIPVQQPQGSQLARELLRLVERGAIPAYPTDGPHKDEPYTIAELSYKYFHIDTQVYNDCFANSRQVQTVMDSLYYTDMVAWKIVADYTFIYLTGELKVQLVSIEPVLKNAYRQEAMNKNRHRQPELLQTCFRLKWADVAATVLAYGRQDTNDQLLAQYERAVTGGAATAGSQGEAHYTSTLTVARDITPKSNDNVHKENTVPPLSAYLEQEIKNKHIKCYKRDNNKLKTINRDSLTSLDDHIDSIQIEDPVTGQLYNATMKDEYAHDAITRYQLWLACSVREQAGTLNMQILAMAPDHQQGDMFGLYNITQPLYWIAYPDMRPILDCYIRTDPNLDLSRMLWHAMYR